MQRIRPPIPSSKASRSISKLEQLTALQQRKNERDANMKQRALKLRNSVLFPSRKRKSSFYSATASSQAKKKRVMEAPTRTIKKQRQKSTVQRGFISHYDRLKKQRNEKTNDHKATDISSMIYSYTHKQKKPKKAKVRTRNYQKRPLTAPKQFAFATSNRMKIRRMRLIEEHKEREKKAENERMERLKKEKEERMKRVKAMRRTKVSMIGMSQSLKKTKEKKRLSKPVKMISESAKKPKIKRHSRQRSVSGLVSKKNAMSPKSKRKRVQRSMSDPELNKNKKKRWNHDYKKIVRKQSKKMKKKNGEKRDIKEINRSMAKKRLKKLKQSLRSGKRVKLAKSKSLENITSAYESMNGNKQSSNNLENKLWLDPIDESDKDTIDLAIDQILTEDVTNISVDEQQKIKKERSEEKMEFKEESLSIEVEMNEDVKNLENIFQMDVDDEKEDVLEFNGGEIAEILNKATNGNKMAKGLKAKFDKLDDLFSEISEKISEFDDESGSSSFEYANELINGIC